jgi:hypothetical protein
MDDRASPLRGHLVLEQMLFEASAHDLAKLLLR